MNSIEQRKTEGRDIEQPAVKQQPSVSGGDMFKDMQKEEKMVSEVSNNEEKHANPKEGKTPKNEKQTTQAAGKSPVQNSEQNSEEILSKNTKTKKSDVEDAEQKIKRMEKMAYDNQKYARHQHQKVTDTLKEIGALVETGDLDEEIATILAERLNKKIEGGEEQDFGSAINNPEHPLDRYKKKINPELFETYLEATSDTEAQLKLKAFDHHLSEASMEEIKNIEDRLEASNTPMGVLKTTLLIGEEQLNSGYREIFKHGGFKGFYREVAKELKELRKKLDKTINQSDTPVESWLGSDSSRSYEEKEQHTGDMFKDMRSSLEKDRRTYRR